MRRVHVPRVFDTNSSNKRNLQEQIEEGTYLKLQKDHYESEIHRVMAEFPDSVQREELWSLATRCLQKFPDAKHNISIWLIAYYEDWVKEYNKALDEVKEK